MTLGALAAPGQILADQPVSEALGVDWDIGPAEDLPGLDDDIEAHVVRPVRRRGPSVRVALS